MCNNVEAAIRIPQITASFTAIKGNNLYMFFLYTTRHFPHVIGSMSTEIPRSVSRGDYVAGVMIAVLLPFAVLSMIGVCVLVDLMLLPFTFLIWVSSKPDTYTSVESTPDESGPSQTSTTSNATTPSTAVILPATPKRKRVTFKEVNGRLILEDQAETPKIQQHK